MRRLVPVLVLAVAFWAAAPVGAAETEGPFTSPCSNNTLWIIDFTIADQDMATITANFDAAPFQLTDVVYQGESTTYFQHGTATMTSVSIDGPRVTEILDVDTYCF